MRVGVLDGHCDDVVLTEDFDGALCTTGTVSNKENGIALLSRVSYVGDPIADTPSELHGRLSGHLMHSALVLE